MENNDSVSRRSFMKSVGAGAAGLTIAGSGIDSVFAAPLANTAWSNGMKINDEIDNRKVVCCTDPEMFTNAAQANVANTFQKQNAAVNTSRVEDNLDGMAMALSGKNNVPDAWAAIFRKPSGKEWSAVKAALKVNCIEVLNMHRVAIAGKICKELIKLGVTPANITIYDACHIASGNDKYTPYANGNGIPQGVVVSSASRGSTQVTVGSKTLGCTSVLVDQSGQFVTDILVNCSVNKGHGQTDKGGYTLSMKNHTGTFFKSGGGNCPTLQEMIDESKSDAIIGGTPPRQQLCVVDSLWATKGGPFGAVSHCPGSIAMGVFGPAVDVMVVRNIREKIMGATHNNSAIQTIVSSYGYSEGDFQWIEVPPYIPTSLGRQTGKQQTGEFIVVTAYKASAPVETRFSIPQDAVVRAEILAINGKVIRTLSNTAHANRLVWDGRSSSGKHVNPGIYLIRITGVGFTRSQQVKLM
ncbi:MAG: DUF362 domain-containing protein [Fibrobacter sp.]|nr:DUF362 domain-containing protein [Fibrobacter sp.]